ncbi:unnamed protein product, partial [Prorocentrum cordatum]
ADSSEDEYAGCFEGGEVVIAAAPAALPAAREATPSGPPRPRTPPGGASASGGAHASAAEAGGAVGSERAKRRRRLPLQGAAGGAESIAEAHAPVAEAGGAGGSAAKRPRRLPLEGAAGRLAGDAGAGAQVPARRGGAAAAAASRGAAAEASAEDSAGSELGSDLDDPEPDEPEDDGVLHAEITRMHRSKHRWAVWMGPGILCAGGSECLFAGAQAVLLLDDEDEGDGVGSEPLWQPPEAVCPPELRADGTATPDGLAALQVGPGAAAGEPPLTPASAPRGRETPGFRRLRRPRGISAFGAVWASARGHGGRLL